MNFLKTYFRVTVYLKSGNTITFNCDEITIKPGSDGGIYSYDLFGLEKAGLPMYIAPSEIEAITYVTKYKFGA